MNVISQFADFLICFYFSLFFLIIIFDEERVLNLYFIATSFNHVVSSRHLKNLTERSGAISFAALIELFFLVSV